MVFWKNKGLINEGDASLTKVVYSLVFEGGGIKTTNIVHGALWCKPAFLLSCVGNECSNSLNFF